MKDINTSKDNFVQKMQKYSVRLFVLPVCVYVGVCACVYLRVCVCLYVYLCVYVRVCVSDIRLTYADLDL